jgi:integrase/recombinase XerC
MADQRDRKPAGAALTLLADGVGLLHPEARVLEAMLVGWEQQMLARNLAITTIRTRVPHVRALVAHANEYPWSWTMATADEWFADLRSVKHCSLSTIRGLQVTIRGFCDYLIDPAYEWGTVCQERFGVAPDQIINEANAAGHVADYEGHPSRRAFHPGRAGDSVGARGQQGRDAAGARRQGLGVGIP